MNNKTCQYCGRNDEKDEVVRTENGNVCIYCHSWIWNNDSE